MKAIPYEDNKVMLIYNNREEFAVLIKKLSEIKRIEFEGFFEKGIKIWELRNENE